MAAPVLSGPEAKCSSRASSANARLRGIQHICGMGGESCRSSQSRSRVRSPYPTLLIRIPILSALTHRLMSNGSLVRRSKQSFKRMPMSHFKNNGDHSSGVRVRRSVPVSILICCLPRRWKSPRRAQRGLLRSRMVQLNYYMWRRTTPPRTITPALSKTREAGSGTTPAGTTTGPTTWSVFPHRAFPNPGALCGVQGPIPRRRRPRSARRACIIDRPPVPPRPPSELYPYVEIGSGRARRGGGS